MVDPYQALDLPRHATEAEVRQRYLELVREFPPDRAPARFAEVRAAYDALRDPARRLEALVLEPETSDSLGAIAATLRLRIRERVDQAPLDLLLRLAERA
jgi:curved DNA-binding protein CbpA